MKKALLIIGVVLFLLGFWFFFLKDKKTVTPVAPAVPTETPVVEIPLEQRPYVTLTPRTDGKEFTLEISRIQGIKTVEYELTYMTEGLSQGVIGSVEVENKEMISQKLLLGSCSRNVCRYHEGVEKGTLTLRLRQAGGTSKFSSDFHLLRGGQDLSSIDGQFIFSGKTSAGSYYLVMSTIGLPSPITGQVTSGPYGIFTSGLGKVSGGKVTFTSDSDAAFYVWSGKDWQKLTDSPTTIPLGTFVAVSS